MRILVLTPTFLPAVGGAEIVLWEVFRRLAHQHEVLLLTPHLNQQLHDHYAHNQQDYPVNFQVQRYRDRFSFMHLRGHKIFQGIIPPFSLSSVKALRTAIRQFKPDVINVHYTMPMGLAAAIANILWRVPTVLTLNGRDVPGPGVPPLWKFWHRLIGRLCQNITYVSEYCRDSVFGPRGPGVVTWNGVDFGAISAQTDPALRSRLPKPENGVVLFALQRLSPEKRVDIIIRSMPAVLEKYPDTILILGGTGPDTAALKQCALEHGVAHKVFFEGFIAESAVCHYFNICDIFVFHSTYETFGIVLAQAMAYAKPIVSVNNTAIPGVAPHTVCSLLVPPFNPTAMAAAIIQLIEDAAMRQRFGAQGKMRAQELFNWDSIALKYQQIFIEAAERNRAP